MMHACVLALIVASAFASNDVHLSAAAAPQLTPQERVLARQPYGNFACAVNSLSVTTENPGDAEKPIVGPQDIRDSFADLATVEWTHAMQTSFSSFDGRNNEKILGTPGGDMGEFIQAIAAYNKVSGEVMTDEEVQRVFERYLKVMTRSKFSYETDEKSYLRIAVATGCKNLRVADMAGMKHKKEAYLKEIATPEYIGDPFIRFLVQNATELEFPSETVRQGLTAFHKVLWSAPSSASQKLCYLEVKGQTQQEQALVHIHSEPWCVDQGLAPMVSPQLACPAPIFINHVEFARLLRREIVTVITDTDKGRGIARDVLAELNAMAEKNLEKFWVQYGVGLPVYTVTFTNAAQVIGEDKASFTQFE